MTAAWTAPKTWATSELVTAALLNTHVRDNLEWLKTPPKGVLNPSTTTSITSTTFVDIWTLPAFTTVGGNILFQAQFAVEPSVGGIAANFDLHLDGVSVGAADGIGVHLLPTANEYKTINLLWLLAGVSAASHTIKLRAKVSGGTLYFRVQDAAAYRNVKAFLAAWEFGG